MELSELLGLKKELLKASDSKDAELALDILRKLLTFSVCVAQSRACGGVQFGTL